MKIKNKSIIEEYKMKNNIPLNTVLYTYGSWYKIGYKVKKGDVCHHRIDLWKHCKNGYYLKTLSLFEKEQVEKI